MRSLILLYLILGGMCCFAQTIEEVRIGLFDHNICVSECMNANKEDGPVVQGEIVFQSPTPIRSFFNPRLYLIASLNLTGDTSYVGSGVHLNIPIVDNWILEPGFGYVIHDGNLQNIYPRSDPRFTSYWQQNLLLGSRDLFRSSLAINKTIDETWGIQIQIDHLSHGRLIGEGENQGLDSLGMRIIRRLQR